MYARRTPFRRAEWLNQSNDANKGLSRTRESTSGETAKRKVFDKRFQALSPTYFLTFPGFNAAAMSTGSDIDGIKRQKYSDAWTLDEKIDFFLE